MCDWKIFHVMSRNLCISTLLLICYNASSSRRNEINTFVIDVLCTFALFEDTVCTAHRNNWPLDLTEIPATDYTY